MEFKKHALILEVINGLKTAGSWTGKTHVQKTMFLVSEATPIQVPFEFVLYKHGPYSFDIENELEQMKSYDAVVVQPISGYGVELKPSENAALVGQIAPLSASEKESVNEICRFVGSKGVVELERLATAVWIRNHDHITDHHEVARRINALKPHIKIPEAEAADQLVITTLNLMPKPTVAATPQPV